MMNKIIVIVIAWSFVIIGIDSQSPEHLSEEQNSIPKHLNHVLEVLDNVVSYFKKIDKKSSNTGPEKKVKPDDTEALALIRAMFMTFWIIVTLRTFSINNSCIFENEPETNIDLYLNEMTFAFSEFKKEIKKYRADGEKEKGERNAGSSGRHVIFNEVTDAILGLSLDFVASTNILKGKSPDKHIDGIIQWKLIKKKNNYRTLFPSCPLIRYLVHKTVVENQKRPASGQVGPSNTWIDPDLLQLYNENNTYTDTSGALYTAPNIDLVNTSPNIREVLEKFYNSSVYTNIFEEELSDDEIFSIYSNNVYWQNIIQDLELMYGVNVETVMYNILWKKVWNVINTQEFYRIQDFFIEKIAGPSVSYKDLKFAETFSRNSIWNLSTFNVISNMWNEVKHKNVIIEETDTEISTQKRIENVIKFIRNIEEINQNTWYIEHNV